MWTNVRKKIEGIEINKKVFYHFAIFAKIIEFTI